MFNFGKLEHLCRAIGVAENVLRETLDDFDVNPAKLVEELTLWPADDSKKPRDVIAVRGNWRLIQERLYRKVFLPRLRAAPWSHGGAKGRSPASNARAHLGNAFAYMTDVSGFFPAISCHRVNQFFLRQACSYDVARVLTRICTHDYHLALGLITSPILANELFRPIDQRIAHACRKLGLTYTRFVDDLTISGNFDLEESGIHGVVNDIVNRYGFRLSQHKTDWGRFDGDISITGVRLKNHHIDASKKYVAGLERLIADHASLANNGEFSGPLLTEGELLGKCHFVCGLNPGRRRTILVRLKAIKWDVLFAHAIERGLVRKRSRLTKRGDERPNCNEPLALSLGAKHYAEFVRTTNQDLTVAPF